MSKNKIFIVDDTDYIRELLKDLLEGFGYEITEAEDGRVALEILDKGYEPDLCLFDVMMPEISGYELCEKFKSIEKFKDTPVIILTALKDINNLLDLFKKGADDYITKPFHNEELLARIKNFLKIKSLQDDLKSTIDKLQETTNKLIEKENILDLEFNLAKQIQEHILPNKKSRYKNLLLDYYNKTSTQLSGDFFDVYKLSENRIAFILTDVVGHGTPAALIIMMIKTLLEQYVYKYESPAILVKKLNDVLMKLLPMDKYCTLIYGIFDFEKNVFRYSNAAHPAPYIIRENGDIEKLEILGSIVGMVDITFNEKEISFNPGDKIILFSDGIIEAKNSMNKMFGFEKFESILENVKDRELDRVLTRIRTEFELFVDKAEILDDITVVGMSYEKENIT